MIMDTSNTLTPAPTRKKMLAEVFVKIYEGEIEVIGTKWEKWVDVTEAHMIAMVPIDKCIKFNRVEIVGDVEIRGYNKESLPRLILSDCNIPALAFINVNSKLICIEKNTRIQLFCIRDTSEIGRVFINSNSSIQDFMIEASSIDSVLCYKECTISHISIKIASINEKFQLGHSKIGLIFFENSIVRLIEIIQTVFERLSISSNSFIVHLRFNFILREPVHILLNHSDFAHLDFGNSIFPEFTTLSISNCNVNRLTLSNFCNYGTIFFNNLSILDFTRFLEIKKGWPFPIKEEVEYHIHLPTIRLSDSDLGKTQFINSDLRQFSRFEFSNTKMLDVFVAGSKMPGDKDFCLPDDEKNPLKIAEQKRLAYGQFKKIYDARGDIAGSLPYLAYEMEAYREQLQMEGWWKNRGELFMLFMNKVSTNYGNSWGRGLWMTLISIIVCYSIFLGSVGHKIGNPFSWDDWKEAFRLYSYAPHFVNPLRDADSIVLVENEKELSPFARFWDFFSRIIVAYFAYQTIQAFRKLGKSSG